MEQNQFLDNGHYVFRQGPQHDGLQLLPGEVNERGEPIETAPETTLGQILHDMLIGKTVKRVSRTAEPKRAPLRYFTERAQFDPFKGYVTKSSTQHQEPQSSFGRLVSPDMQDNGPQTNPVFGSAALVVKG